MHFKEGSKEKLPECYFAGFYESGFQFSMLSFLVPCTQGWKADLLFRFSLFPPLLPKDILKQQRMLQVQESFKGLFCT